jgi:hypothetical protein
MIAAFIAVIGALLALWGVSRQIAAAAKEGQKNRAAEAWKERQAQLIERMAKALELSNRLGRTLRRNHDVPTGEWSLEDSVAYAESLTEGKLLASMLRLLGAQKSSESMLAYLNRVADIAHDPASEGLEEHVVASDLIFTMRDELGSDDSSEVRRWVGGKRQQS